MYTKSLKRIFSILFLMISSIILVVTCYFNFPILKNKFPYLSNQLKAWKYDQLAKKFPQEDYAAKRYRAMADSLRKGKNEYEFEYGPLLMNGK